MFSSFTWTPIHAQLHRTLRQRQLLPKHQKLLVAVSGGQDSLCLAKLLLDLRSKWEWEIAIAHCDHGWRVDSQANAAHVEKLAGSWQLPFYLQTTDRTLLGEASAREWRYQALSSIAFENGFHYVITGHTASDRAETLFYNLIRGSGADGLQSLTWQRSLIQNGRENIATSLILVRPMLEITRAQTARFCLDFQLPVWEDSTNQDLKYARNRIRLETLPYLQQHFNPQVDRSLAQTAELLRAEVEYLEDETRQLLERSTEVLNSKVYGLNRRILREAPLALQRRAMRQFIIQNLATAPNFEQIEKLTALIVAPNRSRTDPFPGGAIAKVDGDWIYLESSSGLTNPPHTKSEIQTPVIDREGEALR